MKQTCLECINFYFRRGSYGYSEEEQGYQADFSCSKDKWEIDVTEDDKEDFISKMLSANECKEFEFKN